MDYLIVAKAICTGYEATVEAPRESGVRTCELCELTPSAGAVAAPPQPTRTPPRALAWIDPTLDPDELEDLYQILNEPWPVEGLAGSLEAGRLHNDVAMAR